MEEKLVLAHRLKLKIQHILSKEFKILALSISLLQSVGARKPPLIVDH
jgi:hypothetical protein